MIKRIGGSAIAGSAAAKMNSLNLEALVEVEVSSEDSAHPVEFALSPDSRSGWRAAKAGPQILRLIFERPQKIKHVHLEFEEHEVARTQQFFLRWYSDGGCSYHDIVRQQYNFSPPHTTEEREVYQVDIGNVTDLELRVIPDISGGSARASLERLRVC